jgi:hypothetical protein
MPQLKKLSLNGSSSQHFRIINDIFGHKLCRQGSLEVLKASSKFYFPADPTSSINPLLQPSRFTTQPKTLIHKPQNDIIYPKLPPHSLTQFFIKISLKFA